MDEHNTVQLNKLICYMLLHFILFIVKLVYSKITKTSFRLFVNDNNTQHTPSERETLQMKINSLKNEVEQYNNPSNFGKYTKMQKQIIQLEKELNVLQLKEKNGKVNNNSNNEFDLMKVVKAYVPSVPSVMFFVVNYIMVALLYKGKYVNVSYEEFKGNYFGNYYYNEDCDCIRIPLITVYFCQTFVLMQVSEGIQKIKQKIQMKYN